MAYTIMSVSMSYHVMSWACDIISHVMHARGGKHASQHAHIHTSAHAHTCTSGLTRRRHLIWITRTFLDEALDGWTEEYRYLVIRIVVMTHTIQSMRVVPHGTTEWSGVDVALVRDGVVCQVVDQIELWKCTG